MPKKKPNWRLPSPEFFRGNPWRLQTYWRNLFDSTRIRMSRGASNIAKLICWSRKENWRGFARDRKRRNETKKR